MLYSLTFSLLRMQWVKKDTFRYAIVQGLELSNDVRMTRVNQVEKEQSKDTFLAHSNCIFHDDFQHNMFSLDVISNFILILTRQYWDVLTSKLFWYHIKDNTKL